MRGFLLAFLFSGSFISIVLGNASEKFFKARKKTIYYMEPKPEYTWHQAALECQTRNMTLLSVETRAKNTEIKNLLYRIYRGSTTPTFYIGGNDLKEFRKFTWLKNDNQFQYLNWYQNEPNNHDELQERCVTLGYYGNDQWNDVNCNTKYGFICEKTLILKGGRFSRGEIMLR